MIASALPEAGAVHVLARPLHREVGAACPSEDSRTGEQALGAGGLGYQVVDLGLAGGLVGSEVAEVAEAAVEDSPRLPVAVIAPGVRPLIGENTILGSRFPRVNSTSSISSGV